jgi:UDP-N-acetylglucosamine acyltransferase
MPPRLHPTAIVHPHAQLADDVEVGPYCLIGENVSIGPGTRLLSHCVLEGPLRLGARNLVHPFAVLGSPPQDRGHRGEPTSLEIGDDNVIREHVTIHRGTVKGGGLTRVGSRCLLMVGVHVAHDVHLGDNLVLTNGTLLGGHVVVGDYAVTGGHVAVAPFMHVGESAFLAGGAMVESAVPPFVIASGDRARVRALNRVGLERRGVPERSRVALKKAFRLLFRSGQPRALAASCVDDELGADPYVAKLIAFVRAPELRRG